MGHFPAQSIQAVDFFANLHQHETCTSVHSLVYIAAAH